MNVDVNPPSELTMLLHDRGFFWEEDGSWSRRDKVYHFNEAVKLAEQEDLAERLNSAIGKRG